MILNNDEMLVVIVLFKNGLIESEFNVGNKDGNKVGIAVVDEFKGILELNNGEIVIVLFKNGLIENGFNVGNKVRNKVERVVVILFKGEAKVESNVLVVVVVVLSKNEFTKLKEAGNKVAGYNRFLVKKIFIIE